MPKKKYKKYPKGGDIKGPSHDDGGVIIKAEGGEYIIREDSVNEETEPILEEINKTGKLSYRHGGKIPIFDARKRGKK